MNSKGTQAFLGGEGVFFIAEAGKNFIQTEDERSVSEYLENAKKLVDAAKEAGADAIKFQTHEVEDEAPNIPFSVPHFQAKEGGRYAWVTRVVNATPLEEFWKPLKQYCDKKEIIFFSTPMSRKAAYKINAIGVPFWKVGSGDVQDYATLDFLLETRKPIIISTGMVSFAELEEVVQYLTGHDVPLAVLYCITQYPAPKESFNLATIEYLQEKYPDAIVGFSDHSLGTEIPLAAIKLGARVIEKHFSLGRDFYGPDHKVSMTPDEFSEMVRAARGGEHEKVDAREYYGDPQKELEGAHNKFRPFFNKALIAGQDIPAGAVVTKEMVYAMRPIMAFDNALPANRYYDVIGKKTAKALKKFDPITEEIFS